MHSSLRVAIGCLLAGALACGGDGGAALQAPSQLTYFTNPAAYLVGVAIVPNRPSSKGGSVESYSVSPALPAGLALDPKRGDISGTPEQVTGRAVYSVTARNSRGATSVDLDLEVSAPTPVINVPPRDQRVAVGGAATFTVEASGTGVLSYQWSKNGVAIDGATAASYTTPPALASDDGARFTVEVSVANGGSASAGATLTVLPGSFSPTGSLVTPREFHQATLLPSGKVFITGGKDKFASLASTEQYNPASGAFSQTGSMSTHRSGHTATLLPSGLVLIVGGEYSSGPGSTAELYDPASGTFTPTGSPTGARTNATATLLQDGTVLVAGGGSGTAELYDPGTGAFSEVGPLSDSRSSHAATLLADGRVLISGGISNGSALATAELYDPATQSFSLTGLMYVARGYHSATLLTDGTVLLVGGSTNGNTGSAFTPVADAELYHPATGSFTRTGAMATARGLHTATRLPDGSVLVTGGMSEAGWACKGAAYSAEIYAPSKGVFRPAWNLGEARCGASATLLMDGSVLVAGGEGGRYGSDLVAPAELYR